ncbi:MAG: purine-nucleoside phosphorylase [Oscillospiraceae bacterium]|nr:purine-nucleoside phosphorylase [Oscillospiraceae bacterium]
MATPHNNAKPGQIAKLVLMPGDPLRAKMVADTYLENVEVVNKVRGMYCFTGTYKGNRVSVMGSGMGIPTIGIYSYELFHFYDVEAIIRIGSTGAMSADLDVYDVVLVDSAYSESSYAREQAGVDERVMYPSPELTEMLRESANELGYKVTEGRTMSSDVFYFEPEVQGARVAKAVGEYNCVCTEMESYALFHNAKMAGKKAGCLLTVSDNLVTQVETTAEERQNSFTRMMEIALGVAKNFQ